MRKDADVPRFLLLKRSSSERIYPGIWQWVMGAMRGSESAGQAAVRELAEETGIRPIRFWIVPYVIAFYLAADDAVHLSPFFAAEVAPDVEPRLSGEHEAFEWCSFERARELLVWPGQRHGLEIVQNYLTSNEQAAWLVPLREIDIVC